MPAPATNLLKIKLFGVIKDLLGQSALEWETSLPLLSSELIEQLKSQYPTLQQLASVRVAIDQIIVEENILLYGREEIAPIPPFSGG